MMSALQLNPCFTAPLLISAAVVWPCKPDSVLSPCRQWATGIDAAAGNRGQSISSVTSTRQGLGFSMIVPLGNGAAEPCRAVRHVQAAPRHERGGQHSRSQEASGLGAQCVHALRCRARMRPLICCAAAAAVLSACSGSSADLTDLAGNTGKREVVIAK